MIRSSDCFVSRNRTPEVNPVEIRYLVLAGKPESVVSGFFDQEVSDRVLAHAVRSTVGNSPDCWELENVNTLTTPAWVFGKACLAVLMVALRRSRRWGRGML
ncbi:hypothetical protein [Coleofasciculus sp. FACHB-501]|uniref:hypothetical protein n=1 Tax=Coleofasciculus sp. FACHB-501 TaxID=2692786 RepID=UPI00168586A9|nr:hypothetical protein [Coleofasciculus sp. FACHB-501]MBD1839167.1 hypothetical protein [Coleofasciculus sp. FACHB-501]